MPSPYPYPIYSIKPSSTTQMLNLCQEFSRPPFIYLAFNHTAPAKAAQLVHTCGKQAVAGMFYPLKAKKAGLCH